MDFSLLFPDCKCTVLVQFAVSLKWSEVPAFLYGLCIFDRLTRIIICLRSLESNRRGWEAAASCAVGGGPLSAQDLLRRAHAVRRNTALASSCAHASCRSTRGDRTHARATLRRKPCARRAARANTGAPPDLSEGAVDAWFDIREAARRLGRSWRQMQGAYWGGCGSSCGYCAQSSLFAVC